MPLKHPFAGKAKPLLLAAIFSYRIAHLEFVIILIFVALFVGLSLPTNSKGYYYA